MPLSAPHPRKLLHTRTIECHGYERDDGLWDIEGRLTDTKTVRHGDREGARAVLPGTPIHDMWFRVTIDLDYTIVAAEAVTDTAPFGVCHGAAPAFGKLTGMRIARGWRRHAAALVGGALGCTHLNELLGRIATVAYQSTSRARHRKGMADEESRAQRLLNTCQAYADTGPLVQRLWPSRYKGDLPA